MSTHTAISYDIVFSTRNRTPVLKRERRDDLFRYMGGIIKNRHSHLYHINGVEQHHRKTTLEEGYRKLLLEAGMEFDARYLF